MDLLNLDYYYLYSDPFAEVMAEMAYVMAMLGAIYLFSLFFAFALVVFEIVCKALVFRKAGEAWWKAIIPFYAEYIICRLAKAPTSWFWGYVASIVAIMVTAFGGTILIFVGIADWSEGLILVGTLVALFSTVLVIPALICMGGILWRFSKAFGTEGVFGLGLLFLPYIFWAILAFGKFEYQFKDESPAPAPHIV